MLPFIKLLIAVVFLAAAGSSMAASATVVVVPGPHIDIPAPDSGNVISATPEEISKVKAENRRLAAKFGELVNKLNEIDRILTEIRAANITEGGRLCAARDSLRADIASFNEGGMTESMKSLKTRERAMELIAEMDAKIRKNRYCLKGN